MSDPLLAADPFCGATEGAAPRLEAGKRTENEALMFALRKGEYSVLLLRGELRPMGDFLKDEATDELLFMGKL